MVYKCNILPIGWLYATYHLLREAGNSIDWTHNFGERYTPPENEQMTMENHPFCNGSIHCHVFPIVMLVFGGVSFWGICVSLNFLLKRSGVWGGLWHVLVHVFHYGSWRWFRPPPLTIGSLEFQKRSEKTDLASGFSLRIQVCPKKGINPTILLWGWDWDHQTYYSREGYGSLAFILFSFLDINLFRGIKSTIPRCSMYGLVFRYIWVV